MDGTDGTPVRDTSKEERLRALRGAIARLERRLDALERRSSRWSWLRLAIFAGGLALSGAVYNLYGWWPAAACLGAAALLFGLAVYCHLRVDRGIARHRAWRALKAAQVARATLDWERVPAGFAHEPRPEHPFEADLNLVGPRSVQQLLDTAVSHEGSHRLRAWLTTPVPDPARTLARQQLVRELLPRPLFRDKLTLHATLAGEGGKPWQAGELLEWLERHAPLPNLGRWVALFGAMAAVNIGLFLANQAGLLPPWWQATVIAYLGLMWARARAIATVWDEALALQGALRQLRAVFGQLERYAYRDTPRLRELCAPFLDPARRPSAYLARLTRVVAALGLRGNPLVGFILNLVVPWDFFFAYRLNRYKTEIAVPARLWMDAWFELEALSSLATYAWLHPAYAFPEIETRAAEAEAPVLAAEGLGHPLLRDEASVRNAFAVPALGQVTVITGSNMAGKSVFLKTVALNQALAQAGGVVCARRLRTLPFRIFTSMAISDSVNEGISYFYAEVRRLSALLAALEEEQALPLLYCIDEIFRGTNNRERLIGGRAYVRALAGKRGVGLIATHDLELTRLAEEVPGVVNYHFRDRVEDNRMVFDYVLRPGPSPTTNALRIMRLQGLPVPDEDSIATQLPRGEKTD